MRIALDLTALLPEATGVDNYMKQLALQLGRAGGRHLYRVFLNYEDRRLFRGALPANVSVSTLCLRPRPCRLFFQQVLLPLAARAWRADVVHSPSFIVPYWRGRQRHVLTVHDMTSFSLPGHHIALRRSALYKRMVLTSIRRAQRVIVPSQATARHLAEIVPDLPDGHVRVIPLGVGDEFRPRDCEQVRAAAGRLKLPPAYILYVGTLEPRKNLPRLVESYRRLVAAHGIAEHLVLAGRLGWDYEQLLTQVDAPELRGRVHLSGYVPDADLPWLYAAARVFVYPSIQEGFGLPPLEAMACGTPVVSSLSSSLQENLEGAAELVPPEDGDALTAAIHRLLTDDALRARRRESGLERAAQFRWEQTARLTLDCYAEAARL